MFWITLRKEIWSRGKALAVGKAVRADEPLQSVPADRGLFHDFRSGPRIGGMGSCEWLATTFSATISLAFLREWHHAESSCRSIACEA